MGKERGKRPCCLLATVQPTAMDNGREHACGRIQGCQGKPVWICHRCGKDPLHFSPTNTQGCPASAQCPQELVRLGPGTPGCGRKDLRVDVEFVEEASIGWPAPPRAGVHHLHHAPVAAPGHDKVCGSVWPLYHDNGWQGQSLGQEHMVDGHQNLLCVQPELHGDSLQGIYGGAIHVSLAGFAQASIAHRQAIAFHEAGECCWTTVHEGGLHNLRSPETASAAWRSGHHRAPSWLPPAVALRGDPPRCFPTPRSTSVAGLIRSTSISTIPGKPCWSGMAVCIVCSRRNSTRTTPSRASVATLVTVPVRLPYCAHGKPSRRSRAGCPGCTRPRAMAGRKDATTRSVPEGSTTPSVSPWRTTAPGCRVATSPR